MELVTGTRVGPYEITAAIGAGGMGEVYRALDTRLDRYVALKILPELVVADPDRLARFQREAKTLAALNHPNIAQIYGIEKSGSIHALAMEFVDGEDLAQRLERGALPVDEAVGIARQIADALETAHDLGIIHRDLKPANVKVRGDGAVKVLDFGLAKAVSTDVAGAPSVMNSPTFTSPAVTQMGIILGTAAYMSPEQARGRAVDRRADIWAYGCVLYEMLTGRRPFGGDDVSLTLASVLKEEADFTALPVNTPVSVRRLLRRCLQKDPRKRLSSIADARLELEEPPGETAPAASPAHTYRRTGLPWAAAGAAASAIAIVGYAMLARSPLPSPSVVRSQIVFSSTTLYFQGTRAFALHPAGGELVFVGSPATGEPRLFRLRFSEDTPIAIPGTEGAMGPYFSVDGKWLAFVQHGRLKKMPSTGGGTVDLGDVFSTQGGSFTRDGTLILNAGHGAGLFSVAPDDSTRKVLTTVAHEKGEAGHHWPHVLPDGKHVLFVVEIDGKTYSEARIEVLSLETGQRRVLIEGGTDARYVATGHLVYWREGAIWSVPFDLTRLQVAGTPTAAVQDVMAVEPNGYALFDVAADGTLVYVPGRDPHQQRVLTLVDRGGAARPFTNEQRAFESIAVSPDGRRIAATIIAANDSLWTTELSRPSFTRITFEAENSRPVWSPDGARLALTRHRGGEPRRIFIMPADGSAAPELLRDSGDRSENTESWSRDNVLAFVRHEPAGPDIWTIKVDGDREARPLLTSRFAELFPRFSPDGKWLAYTSDESGRSEVYVRPFPGPGPKHSVSSGGGTQPRWRGDGREIFYRNGDEILAAPVTLTPAFTLGTPAVVLKSGAGGDASLPWTTWDVLPDGKTFVTVQDLAKPPGALSLVQNWFQELKKP